MTRWTVIAALVISITPHRGVAEQEVPCASNQRLVKGVVLDLLSRAKLPEASIVIRKVGWLRDKEIARVSAQSDGTFVTCVPAAAGTVLARATFGGINSRALSIGPDRERPISLYIQITSPVTLSGYITDGGGPVSGASIELADGRMSAISDSMGFFLLEGVPPGQQILSVSSSSFFDRVDTLELLSGQPLRIDLVLGTQAISIEAVEVVADVTTDAASGLPVTAFQGVRGAAVDSLKKRVTTMEQLLRGARIPSIRIRRNRNGAICVEDVRRASPGDTCQMVDLYLNGSKTSRGGMILGTLDPLAVSRIEFLRRSQAGVAYDLQAGGALFIDLGQTR